LERFLRRIGCAAIDRRTKELGDDSGAYEPRSEAVGCVPDSFRIPTCDINAVEGDQDSSAMQFLQGRDIQALPATTAYTPLLALPRELCCG
jgi:hypothetical protein